MITIQYSQIEINIEVFVLKSAWGIRVNHRYRVYISAAIVNKTY